MARIRSVHPSICVSETMARLSAPLERTFVRLWTHCDDDGRCVDNPKLIKAALFPLQDEMTAEVVDRHLDELQAEGLVRRYEAEGKRCVSVCSWAEYQHPKHPRPSLLPVPPESAVVIVVEAPVPAPEPSGEPCPPIRGTMSPNPGTASPPVDGEGEGVGDGGGEGVLASGEPTRKRRTDPIWEALLAACAVTGTITPSARGAYNRAVADLRAVDATVNEIALRAEIYRLRWPDVSLTPTALARRWAECEPDPRHLPGRHVSRAEAALARIERQ